MFLVRPSARSLWIYVALTSLLLVGCGDETIDVELDGFQRIHTASEEPPEECFRASPDALKALVVDGLTFGCDDCVGTGGAPCTLAELDDECPYPGTWCDPQRGFSCVGFPQEVMGACPDFHNSQDSNMNPYEVESTPYCFGRPAPRRCSPRSPCPPGAFCDLEAGHICNVECIPGESGMDCTAPGESCSCDGRCLPDGDYDDNGPSFLSPVSFLAAGAAVSCDGDEFPLRVTVALPHDAAAVGACCSSNGCEDTARLQCDGKWIPGQSCDEDFGGGGGGGPVRVCETTGACCGLDSACVDVTGEQCSGIFRPAGTCGGTTCDTPDADHGRMVTVVAGRDLRVSCLTDQGATPNDAVVAGEFGQSCDLEMGPYTRRDIWIDKDPSVQMNCAQTPEPECDMGTCVGTSDPCNNDGDCEPPGPSVLDPRPDWQVQLRHGQHPDVSLARLGVSVIEQSGVAQEGVWEGEVRLVATGIVDDSSSDLDLSSAPHEENNWWPPLAMGRFRLPVRAEVSLSEPGMTLDIAIVDSSRVLSPSGLVFVAETFDSLSRTTTEGTYAYLGSTDGAAVHDGEPILIAPESAIKLPVIPGNTLGDSAWTYEAGLLSGLFSTRAASAHNGTSKQVVNVWRLSVRLVEKGGLLPIVDPKATSPLAEERASEWVDSLGSFFLPSSFESADEWMSLRHSLPRGIFACTLGENLAEAACEGAANCEAASLTTELGRAFVVPSPTACDVTTVSSGLDQHWCTADHFVGVYSDASGEVVANAYGSDVLDALNVKRQTCGHRLMYFLPGRYAAGDDIPFGQCYRSASQCTTASDCAVVDDTCVGLECENTPGEVCAQDADCPKVSLCEPLLSEGESALVSQAPVVDPAAYPHVPYFVSGTIDLPVSGGITLVDDDFIDATGPLEVPEHLSVPATNPALPFAAHADRRELGLDEESLSADMLLLACLEEMERTPAAPMTGHTLADLPERLPLLFRSASCVDLQRFVPAIDWLSRSTDDDGQALFVGALTDWLRMVSFVANQTRQDNETATLVGDSGIKWIRALEVVNSGLGLLLHPRLFEGLTSLGANGSDLPLMILAALTAQMKLVDAMLQEAALQAYAECYGGGDSPTRDKALARYGDSMRMVLMLEAVAKQLAAANQSGIGKMRGSNAEFTAARDMLQATVTSIEACDNPLGINEDDLPLYFGDPVGVSSRFFASSDYITQVWATPAVAAASSSVESARATLIQQRNAEIQQQVLEQDRDRRLDAIAQNYGARIIQLCGFEAEPLQVWESLRNGTLDISGCWLVRSDDCKSVEERVLEETSYDYVNPCPQEAVGLQVLQAKTQLCSLGLDRSEHVNDNTPRTWNAGWDQAIGAWTGNGAAATEPTSNDLVTTLYEDEDARPRLRFLDVGLADESCPDSSVPGNQGSCITKVLGIQDGHFLFSPLTSNDGREVLLPMVEVWNLATLQLVGELFRADMPPTFQVGVTDSLPPAFPVWATMDAVEHEDCGRYFQLAPNTWIALADLQRLMEHYAASYDAALSSVHYNVVDADCDGIENCEDLFQHLYTASRGRVCNHYAKRHTLPQGVALEELQSKIGTDPLEVAACYRGEIGASWVNMLIGSNQARSAAVGMDTARRDYGATMEHCFTIEEANSDLAEAYLEYQRVMVQLADADPMDDILNVLGAVAAAVGSIYSGGATLAGYLALVAGFASVSKAVGDAVDGDDDDVKAARAKAALQNAQLLASAVKEISACFTGAESQLNALEVSIESVKLGRLSLASALVSFVGDVRTLLNVERAGRAEYEREALRPLHSYNHPEYAEWHDEAIGRLQRDMGWARRTLYLAMRAAEYELQQSLSLRGDILTAKVPDDLQAALLRLKQAQASRTINGRRPEDKILVVSLRDEVLALEDWSHEPNSENPQTPAERFQDLLRSRQHAYYDESGNYLGQALPLRLDPIGPLEHRCAERMWSVGATIQGDLIGYTAPNVPLFLMKNNSFESQWCNNHEQGDSPRQIASIRPSVDLFRPDETGPVDAQIGSFTWGYVDAWLNVKRKDFYADAYLNGSSAELAGRGLYGEYRLLIPASALGEEGLQLDRIEDILLRFEYLSVDDGPAGDFAAN